MGLSNLLNRKYFIEWDDSDFWYFPGQDDPDTVLNIVFIFLFSTVILASISFVCAIAGDIETPKS